MKVIEKRDKERDYRGKGSSVFQNEGGLKNHEPWLLPHPPKLPKDKYIQGKSKKSRQPDTHDFITIYLLIHSLMLYIKRFFK